MDLLVDASLDDTNSHLRAIHDEFSSAKDHAVAEARIWGQHDLHDAMTAFVENWWVHRDKIDKRLKGLSDKVDQACQAWTDADKQLTESLTTDSSHA